MTHETPERSLQECKHINVAGPPHRHPRLAAAAGRGRTFRAGAAARGGQPGPRTAAGGAATAEPSSPAASRSAFAPGPTPAHVPATAPAHNQPNSLMHCLRTKTVAWVLVA